MSEYFQERAKQALIFRLLMLQQSEGDCFGIKEELKKELNKREEILTRKMTTFLGGSSVSVMDHLIWPWFERMEVLELREYAAQNPNLKLWMAAVREDPTVKALLLDRKNLQNFIRLYFENSPEAWDYGL
ncbi:Glutathione S-transferase omega-1 [Fukomys damarensis]|uniref:Glutathione-dependent dehydroascorbate reductase n=1 Tax=Fukomys damarensis TaxID=885580 RepID=A0A091DHN0_FUKDA|nr:Glutathione S-transferase omega-1 [Fukomys damarensis]